MEAVPRFVTPAYEPGSIQEAGSVDGMDSPVKPGNDGDGSGADLHRRVCQNLRTPQTVRSDLPGLSATRPNPFWKALPAQVMGSIARQWRRGAVNTCT